DDLEVQGQDKRQTSRLFCAVYQTSDKVAIFHHIELEPERVMRIRSYILDRTYAHGGERVWNSRLRRRARDENFAVTALHTDDPGWGQRHRHTDGLSHHRGGKRAV